MSTPKTLLALLNQYKIEIPRVQRDYVQGRKDERSKIVRTNLLNDIKAAYEGRINPLDLSFVYGKTTNNNKFLPVDGQQRLTTLLLLHLFAFSDDDTKTPLFEKFSYEARITTRDFFKALVANRKEVFSSTDSPKEIIEDAAWFVDSWKYDPSVCNVLNTLDDISRIGFNIVDLRTQLEELNNPKVFFHFVELDKLGMEDDLYIKLNARGRELSPFESFKSKFIDCCNDACPALVAEFKKNLDVSWTDYIWNIGKENFDTIFLRFFETVFLNADILKSEANKVVSENWFYNLDYNSIPGDIFTGIRNTMNFLVQRELPLANELIEKAIIDPATYSNKVLFHAVSAYLSDENDAKAVDKESFADWLRVFVNLVNNSRIEEADTYQKTLGLVNNIKTHKKDLLSYLALDPISSLPWFLEEQFKEECQKARIMCKDSLHKKIILEAEKGLPYFSGQIRSVLYYSNYEMDDDIAKFNKYLNAEKVLFAANKPVCGNLLRRALCAIGDYRLPVNSYRTLCIDDPNESSRTGSLKRLFSNHRSEVKKLLDSINASLPVEPQLEQIIANKQIKQNDWRYCIVNYGDILFKLMSVSHMRMCNNTKEELIVPNKQSNGVNYSLYLYTLQHMLEKEGITSHYFTEFGATGDRYLEVKGSKVRFENKIFSIYDDTGACTFSNKRDDVLDEVIDQIRKM